MATTTTTTTTTTTHDAWAVDAHLAAFHRALLPADGSRAAAAVRIRRRRGR